VMLARHTSSISRSVSAVYSVYLSTLLILSFSDLTLKSSQSILCSLPHYFFDTFLQFFNTFLVTRIALTFKNLLQKSQRFFHET